MSFFFEVRMALFIIFNNSIASDVRSFETVSLRYFVIFRIYFFCYSYINTKNLLRWNL